MKKIYDKSEIWFAVMWIIIHVVGVSITDSLSESIGIPHLITLFFSIAMILVLLSFMKKNGLMEKYGLCIVTQPEKQKKQHHSKKQRYEYNCG